MLHLKIKHLPPHRALALFDLYAWFARSDALVNLGSALNCGLFLFENALGSSSIRMISRAKNINNVFKRKFCQLHATLRLPVVSLCDIFVGKFSKCASSNINSKIRLNSRRIVSSIDLNNLELGND